MPMADRSRSDCYAARCFIRFASDLRRSMLWFLDAELSTEHLITWLRSHAAGVIMRYSDNKCWSDFPICFRPGREQVQISEALECCGREGRRMSAVAIASMRLFRTLLHQLMTAQIRVHDLDLSALDEPAAEPVEVA